MLVIADQFLKEYLAELLGAERSPQKSKSTWLYEVLNILSNVIFVLSHSRLFTRLLMHVEE